MPKKIKINEGVYDAFKKLFFTAKAYGKEKEVGQQLLDADPKLKTAWDQFNNDMDDWTLQSYKRFKELGLDVTDFEKTLKKRGIKY